MPSRKKAKGKARKAKAKEGHLILHNDSVCRHGCEPISKDDICYKFVKQFEVELNAAFDLYYDTHHQLADLYNETFDRLQANNQFNMIWDDKLMQKRVLPLFVSLGTNLILSTKTRSSHMASVVAMVIATSSHNFDRSEAIRQTERTRCLLRDLEDGLEYDSARLLFKSSPCQCLKKMYYLLKPLPRNALCYSCLAEKDRKLSLYLCSGCKFHAYCSVECQTIHWPDHKSWCKRIQRLRPSSRM